MGDPRHYHRTIHMRVKIIKRSLKQRQVLLFPVISLLIMILLPVSCLADAQKIFKENNKAVVVIIAYDEVREALSQRSHIANYENTSEYWLNQGNAYFLAGMKRSARDAFNKAIEIKPDYIEAYFNRGLVYVDLADFQQAIKDFTRAIEIKPDFAEAYLSRGTAYYGSGNYQQAIREYNKALELKPDFAGAYFNRGLAYGALRDFQQAIKEYNKAIELKSDYMGAYFNRGMAYGALRDFQQAIKDFTKAIEIKPDFAEAYTMRGTAYNHDSGDTQHAMKDYNKAIELKPDFADAYYEKACLFAITNNTSEACSLLKTAIKKGYSNWKNIRTDSDLDNIRNSTCYKEIIVGR